MGAASAAGAVCCCHCGHKGPLLDHLVGIHTSILTSGLWCAPPQLYRLNRLYCTLSHCPCWQVGLSAAPPPSAPLPSAVPPSVPPAGAPGTASAASAGAEPCGGRDAGADAAGAAAEAGRPSQPDHGPTAGVVGAAGVAMDAQTVADAVFRQVRDPELGGYGVWAIEHLGGNHSLEDVEQSPGCPALLPGPCPALLQLHPFSLHPSSHLLPHFSLASPLASLNLSCSLFRVYRPASLPPPPCQGPQAERCLVMACGEGG